MVKRVDAENTKLEVKYCIPEWLRDEQIKMSCQRFTERFQPSTVLMDEPVALVCFGPSLNQTWEEIKKFKYIITCSGSHKFIRGKGMVPTWHVDVDPRPHKVKLIGDDIHPDTTFLMASCCHPEVFNLLENHHAKVVLWHTYSGETKEMLPLVYPRGEWVVTGGANAGLRALTLARALGFTDVHIFGMDGSFPTDGKRHADTHPNAPQEYIIAEYNGKEYATTTGFLECARMVSHELEMLPDINYTFYGEGLVQDMLKEKKLNRKPKVKIAFSSANTITKEYIEQNKILHKTNPIYGVSVLNHLDTIKRLYDVTNSKSLLDYGCGKGMLGKNLDFPIWEYDPAIPGKETPPRCADLVVCIDVLEHVEPECLDAVIEDLARCVKQVGYFVVSTCPAIKTLPDGRNTHLIQQDKQWWVDRLSRYFYVPPEGVFVVDEGKELRILVSLKQTAETTQNKFILTT